MRILTVVHDFLPRHFAGTEYMTYLLARGLQQRGHALHLLFAERDTGREAYSTRCGEFGGLRYTEVAYDSIFEDYSEMYDNPSMAARLVEVIETFEPDLVHFQHTVHFGVGCFRVVAQHGIPIVATLHEYYLLCPRGTLLRGDGEICTGPSAAGCGICMSRYPIRPERYGREAHEISAAFTDALERRAQIIASCCAFVDRFCAPSRFLTEYFNAAGLPFHGRVEWIPAGLPILGWPLPKDSENEGSLVFGYVGTLAEHKGVHHLVRAFRRLTDPRCVLEIHGEPGWFPTYADELRRAAEGDSRIRFKGSFDPRSAHTIHARLDALVVPSLWYENSPIAIMEARRQKLPVIATDLGGMREAVRDEVDGLLFPRADEDALAERLRTFAADGELRERLREHSGGVRPLEEMVVDYEELFSRILSSGAA